MPISHAELKALLKLYDKPIGSFKAIGLNKRMAERMVTLGFAERVAKRPLTYVGTSYTLYKLTEKGRREALLTGKRFVPIIGDNK